MKTSAIQCFFIVCIVLFNFNNFESALGSPSPLSTFRPQLDMVYEAIDEGDNERVFNIVFDISSDDNIGAYVKGAFFMEVGQRYDLVGKREIGINAYKEILPLKDDFANEGILPAFYNSALRLIAGNYLVLGKPKLACEYGRQLIFEQRSKPAWKSFIFVAHCEYLQENFEKALAEAKIAKSVAGEENSNDAERQVLSIQAAVYQKLGRNRDAVAALSKMYDTNPTPPLKTRINELREKYNDSIIDDEF